MGLSPIVVRASSSSLTFIVPISAAKADPDRPARIIAVKRGPNSLNRERLTKFATNTSAPNRSIGTAD